MVCLVAGGSLVQLLLANLDVPALAALVLEESEDGSRKDAEHEDISCGMMSVCSY